MNRLRNAMGYVAMGAWWCFVAYVILRWAS